MNQEQLDQLLIEDVSPQFYRHYASLFQHYFSLDNQGTYRTLDKAGHCLFQLVMHIDRQEDNFEDNTGVCLDLQLESILLLSELFSTDHAFWQDFRHAQSLFAKRQLLEKRCHSYPSLKNYRFLAQSRAGLATVALHALKHLDSSTSELKGLERSHALFTEAFQLYDDCCDFREDAINGQFNWAIYRYRLHYKQELDAAHFFSSVLFNELMLQVIDLIKNAQSLVHAMGDSHYLTMLDEFKASVKRTLAN